MLDIGQDAPNAKVRFTSSSEMNEDFELSMAYESGTTVLYFFPAVFTEVCVESTCELRDDLDEFSKLEANIFGISTDMPYSQRQFIIRYELNYPLLSDFNKEAITQFEISDNNYDSFFQGVAQRSLFVIKDGKIVYNWTSKDPWEYPPFDKLKESLHR